MTETVKALTSGRRLARSVVWNLAGLTAPLLIGLVAIPLLIDGMGKERFGLLTIIWMGVGYFSLFDMGLGRALTKLVAERVDDGRDNQLDSLIWTALWMILALGFSGAVILYLGAGPLIQHVFNVQSGLEREAEIAFRILAVGLPFVIVTAALRGLLEAYQRFELIAAIRVPMGAITFLGPLITLQFSPSLVWATTAMLAGRILATSVYFLVAASMRSGLINPRVPLRQHVKPLFSFGGWLTVTNLVGPLMVYFDRFLLGAVLTMTAVAYYTTPYEVLSRLQMLPAAIIGVLFPALSTAQATDRLTWVRLYERTARVLVVLMVPAVGFFFLFAPEALNLWLGQEFSQHSTPVVRWLALGWLVNVMARTPLTALQTGGRPDLVAKTHMAELIPYGLLLWFLTIQFGIGGTAAAWFVRVLIDTLILNELTRRLLPDLKKTIHRTYVELCLVLVVAAGLLWINSFTGRALAMVAITAIVAVPALRIGQQLLASYREKPSTV